MNQPDRNRESIWSIPYGWRTAYFITFSVLQLIATGFIIADEVGSRGNASLATLFSEIAERVAVSGLALAITIFALVEVLSFTMVTGNYIRQRWLEPLKEKQREEGRVQGIEQGREEGREQGIKQGIEQGVKQGIEQGVEQGIDQNQRLWEEWNERRVKAETDGVPFDEAPPAGRRAKDESDGA